MSQLKKGAFLSYINIILTNVIGLVLTPFIIRKLGNSDYGLYTLIGSFVTYLTVMDLGLNNSIIRFVSIYRIKKDKKGENDFLSTVMLIYSILSLIAVIAGIIIYYNLDIIFKKSLHPDELSEAKVMFLFLIFDLALSLPGGSFSAICTAYEYFLFPKAISIIRYILRSILIVAILTIGGKAISIVAIDTVLNLAVILITAVYTFKKTSIKFSINSFSRQMAGSVFSYSLWVFAMILISQLMWSTGQVILGIKVNTATVAIYAVGVMLGTYYSTFSSAVSGVFLPKAATMAHENSTTEQTLMLIKIGRLSFSVLMYVLVGFYFMGKEFIYLWLGKTYHDSWFIALLIMISYTIPLIQTFANALIEAKNLVKYKAITYFFCIVSGLVLGYNLIKSFGATGMIIGLCAGWLIAQLILNVIYYKLIGLNIPYFFKSILFDKLFAMVVATIFCSFILTTIVTVSWPVLTIKAVIFSIIYGISVVGFGLNSEEKKLIFN